MTQFIKELGVINLELQTQIIELALKQISNSELEQSQLYSSNSESKFVDLDKRNSKFKAIVNDELFDTVERLIKILNKQDKFYDFRLVRNDVTYIKYEEGNFFKPHEDYLSFTSNGIEEFTLIMCVSSTCTGGRTIFHINDYFTHKSTSSTTPLSCLVFRKDLKHEGERLESGTKEILTLNLLGLPKNCSNLVVVSFPNEPDSRMYYISVDKINSCDGNLLQGFVRFKCDERILVYKETNYTYQEFELIYRILNKSYISIEEFKTHKAMLDYYLISVSNVLITELQSPNTIQTNIVSFDSELIINETPEQTAFMLELVKTDELQFIPFRLVLVEGTKVYGGEMSDSPPDILEMSPVWLSVTDYDNVVFYKCLTSRRDNSESLKYILDKNSEIDFTKFFESKKTQVTFVNSDDVEDEDDEDDEKKVDLPEFQLGIGEDIMYGANLFKFDLKVCKPDVSYGNIVDFISKRDSDGLVDRTFYSPRNNTIVSAFKHYSIDEHGKMVLSLQQQKAVMKRIRDLNLEETVKSRLNTIRFNLPQKKTTLNENFCNESVYGNCTVLFVTGFIKMV